jgi:CDP-glucose 4,6-dehydratase
MDLVESVAIDWGEGASWECHSDDELYEAGNLDLDSRKAQQDLGWTQNWNLDQAIKATIEWYRAQRSNGLMAEITRAQIQAYVGSRESPRIPASEC